MTKVEDKKTKLLEVLLEIGKITKDDVEKVLHLHEETHEKIDRILLNLGIISEEDLRDALARLFKLNIWQKKKGEKLLCLKQLSQLLGLYRPGQRQKQRHHCL